MYIYYFVTICKTNFLGHYLRITKQNINKTKLQYDTNLPTNRNFTNLIINGKLANQLTINCQGTACDGSLILCPISISSSCNIYCNQGSCKYATIHLNSNNSINSLNLQCGYSFGCQSIYLQFISPSINQFTINCSNTSSCNNSSFFITSTIAKTLINCKSSC